MPLFDHFSLLAPYYEHFIQLKDPEKLIRIAKLPVDGAILDAGGGTGRVTQSFKGLASALVVADVSCEMLFQASEKGGLDPVCSYIERLPFPDHHFERVVMVDALHHVCNQKKTVGEMWRVLKPGGRLVIEEPDIQHFSVKLIAIAEKLALMRSSFLAPENIGAHLTYPDARMSIEREGYNAWVIVDKLSRQDES
jgi:demethylmenaquinone methyltransferase/2-methoxy-6-polyprenyl-1,4-benzoquinol methylase